MVLRIFFLLELLPQLGPLLHPLHFSLSQLLVFLVSLSLVLFPTSSLRSLLITILLFHVKSEDTGACFELPLCILPGSVHLVFMILLIVVMTVMSGLSSSSLLILLDHL